MAATPLQETGFVLEPAPVLAMARVPVLVLVLVWEQALGPSPAWLRAPAPAQERELGWELEEHRSSGSEERAGGRMDRQTGRAAPRVEEAGYRRRRHCSS